MRRSRPRSDIPTSQHLALGHAFTSGDCERRESDRRKNAAEASQAQTVEHRKLHHRSRVCDDEPTPAFLHAVELEPRGNAGASASTKADLKVRLYFRQELKYEIVSVTIWRCAGSGS